MTQNELLEHIADALQRDGILELDMNLDSIEEWDSLAIISIIALFDNLFNVEVTGNMLSKCKSVKDVIAIVSNHIKD